jgi:hypothetical protein
VREVLERIDKVMPLALAQALTKGNTPQAPARSKVRRNVLPSTRV